MTRRPQRGFSLSELMVVVAIIAIMMSLAVPSFGTGVRAGRERGVLQRMTQDFMWARGAAAANDASVLNAALSGPVVITFQLNADCSWATKINGTQDDKHTMASAKVTTAAPGISCSSGSFALPATFTFTPQGFVDTSGTVNFNGTTSATPVILQILYSGAMFRSMNAS